jgi:hypothetical protein
MTTVLDTASDRGADSRTTGDHGQDLTRQVWDEIFSSSSSNTGTGSRSRPGSDLSANAANFTSKHKDDDHISFSDIFSEIKTGFDKVIDILTGDNQPPANTGIEKGSKFPLDNVGSMSVTPNANGKPGDLEYADGSKRHFKYDSNNNVTSFVDRTGHQYSRDANGVWDGPDGKPANISNVNVMPDGTFSYKETQTGNVIVTQLDGSYKTVSAGDLGDLKLYPDSQDRANENTRIGDLASQPNYLNPNGQKLLSELNKLGVDNVDALYGSHIVFSGDGTKGGDGGKLYQQLIAEYPSAKERNSSHYPGTTTKQYQIITGPGNSAVLFGLTPEGNTFIQFEKDAAGSASHTNDYNLYRTLNQNIGPLGTSPHTDKNPLELGYPG